MSVKKNALALQTTLVCRLNAFFTDMWFQTANLVSRNWERKQEGGKGGGGAERTREGGGQRGRGERVRREKVRERIRVREIVRENERESQGRERVWENKRGREQITQQTVSPQCAYLIGHLGQVEQAVGIHRTEELTQGLEHQRHRRCRCQLL